MFHPPPLGFFPFIFLHYYSTGYMGWLYSLKSLNTHYRGLIESGAKMGPWGQKYCLIQKSLGKKKISKKREN